MRKKTPKAVAGFASTQDAFAFESYAREHAVPGRSIPLPGALKAGCGLAWCLPNDSLDELGRYLDESGVTAEVVGIVELY